MRTKLLEDDTMTTSLASALQSVDLVPGNYVCHVKQMRVEVKVMDTSIATPSGVLDYSEEMLDPWVDLTNRFSGTPVTVTPGKLPPPDVPELPEEFS
jgi:hypothetical protein